MILYSSLNTRQVLSKDTDTVCGTVTDCAVHFKNASVYGLTVQSQSLLAKKHYSLLLQDITSWSNGITIQSPNDLTDPDEIVRLADCTPAATSLIHLSAQTVSGTKLGVILDFSFDEITGLIVNYYVGVTHMVTKPEVRFLIPRTAVKKLTPAALIVKDDTIPIQESEVTEEETSTQPSLTPEPSFISRSDRFS